MSQHVFKMPDLGEGTVEAEIVAWHVKVGDTVAEDQIIVEVMTDKAAVEVPAPVSGRVLSVSGAPGDKIPVGSPLIVFETDLAGRAGATATHFGPTGTGEVSEPSALGAGNAGDSRGAAGGAIAQAATSASSIGPDRVMASPATRRRAREAGVDLSTVAGSGPGGRIMRGDIAGTSNGGESPNGAGHSPATAGAAPGARAALISATPTTEIKVIGVRRLIAERMSEAKRNIPHFAYVEEVDVTELEALRRHLNSTQDTEAPALTYLPLVVMALTRALESFPQCNVLYDAARGVLVRHAAVHVGIATQTPDGLKVPVVRNAQSLSLWDLAAEIRRVSEAARTNRASRDELVGSTITVTSLGKLGGIASTPVINSPEVTIIGLNKAVERPVIRDGAVAVRRIMNLSSSFDHRFVDGYDAAAMIQSLKGFLEHPATIFIPKVNSA